MSAQTALQRNSASQPGRPDDIADLSALDLIERYRTKSLSSVEATQAVLARIERLDRHVNAFALLDAESALASARESEVRWQRGERLGPVDGVPVALKDLILARGWPTLRGSRAVDPAQDWSEDSPATARLRAIRPSERSREP
ncbi:amidase family protein [Bradyrhizobium sp. AZCC 1693]|uniref:amidase family protein n=1 Tax=Bradyrhizobium sp. AZCC 1693 TaxID=3117029 RepID=UPI002FEF3BE9